MNLILSLAVTQLGFGLSHAGYCNWGNDGTGASSTCNGINQGGSWCNVGQTNCEEGCQGRWCTNDGDPTPPTPPPSPPLTPPPVSSNSGIATTTRYWDCSGGACGCAYVPSGFGESEPVHCHSNAMFEAPSGNSYGAKFYGSAAISEALGGGNWMAEGCGKCWRVTGTSNAGSIAPGVETTLVLKGTNFCPPGNAPCENGKAHFDIAAPGFDVAGFSLSNTCDSREAEEDKAGFKACGRWMIDSQDPEVGCDCSAFNDETLRTGCQNFLSLYWDNPTVTYDEVPCPQELSSLHCAHPYAFEDVEGIPETCASNDYLTEPNPTTANPTEEPTPEPTPPPVEPETTTSSTITTTTSTTSTIPETTEVTTTRSSEVTTTASSSSCNGCSWDNGANCPDAWCNQNKANCNVCTGTFFGSDVPTPSTPTKPTLRPVIASDSPTDTSKCGCSSCAASILSRDASGYSVISRIDWVVANMAKTEIEACNLVCGDEFPTICGECDPSSCNNDEDPSPTPPSPTPPAPSAGDGTPGFTTTWTSDPNTIQGGACEYATPSATAQGDSWLSPFVKSGNYCGVTLDLFEGGAACGRCYLVKYDGSPATDLGRPGEQIVQIVETGTAGGYTNLFDCFIDAKERITGSDTGIFPITYSQVDCPNPASPAAVVLDGNNAWYVKVLLAGGPSGIVSATLRIGESTFPLSRVAGATFSASTNNAQGPASFDVTYDNGDTATIDGCFGGAWPVDTSSVCD